MPTSITKVTFNLHIFWKFLLGLSPADVRDEREFKLFDTLADGNAVDQAQILHFSRQSITQNTTNSHDLAGGLTDAGGNTLTFLKMKGIAVHNRSQTPGEYLTIDGSVANDFLLMGGTDPTFRLDPNEVFLWWGPAAAGKAVTGGTADIFAITEPNVAAGSYDMLLIGTDA